VSALRCLVGHERRENSVFNLYSVRSDTNDQHRANTSHRGVVMAIISPIPTNTSM